MQNLLSSSLLSKTLKITIYRTINLPVVLYGCETWSLTFKEEHRLRVFENRALTGIFGPKREEVTGEWRKLHNGELNDLDCSPNIVRVIKARKINPLTPNDHTYSGRTAPLTSKRCILYIYSTNTGTEYFKHGIYSPFFFLFRMQFVL